MQLPPGIHTKENSLLAKLAARVLKSRSVALVFGSTIHLHGVDTNTFLHDDDWVKHELKHVEQYRHYGFLRFIVLYLLESLRNGYQNNRFEIEARAAENGKNLL